MAESTRGVVDIIFLMDATGSMAKCIGTLKDNLRSFFKTMTSSEGNGSPVTDWRAKVVGYRDYEVEGPGNWLENNPFVSTVEELNNQLSGIEAFGGGDEAESLLDALFTVTNIGETGVQESPDPNKWRYRYAAARYVVVFSDATYKTKMAIPEAAGMDIEMISPLFDKQKIHLFVFAPDAPCYNELATFPRSVVKSVAGKGLAELTSDPANFTNLLQQLAKSVSKSANVVEAVV